MSENLHDIYQILSKAYGHQGWWPIKITAACPPGTVNSQGYHPGDYSYPQDDQQKLEICIGAILVQNTNWKNAIKAMDTLDSSGFFSLKGLLEASELELALAIKSAGYYNQKTRYLKNMAQFLQNCSFKKLEQFSTPMLRNLLLKLKGIGAETADKILLYALERCSFVVDAYTKRILLHQGIISPQANYESIKKLFQASLAKEITVFQEYHALLVLHGKKYYSKKPYGSSDFLLKP